MADEYLVEPELLLADDSRNLSRAGMPPEPEAVEAMAGMLLTHGQLSPVEVDLSGWGAWEDPYAAGDEGPDAYFAETCEALGHPPLVYGFCRRAAAILLRKQGRTSERWRGLLRVTPAPTGLTREELEDRNLVENLGQRKVAFVDLGLAAHRLTARPEDGGRGEEPSVAARKLGVTLTDLRRLQRLPALCPEARALSRLHHRDPERGITPTQALKLAARTLEEQQRIIREARDAGGDVTPKAARAVIAPLSGRQGQPPGATGAQLERVRARLEKMARSPEDLQRHGLTADQARLAAAVAAAMRSLDDDALAALPGRLGEVIEREFSRVGPEP